MADASLDAVGFGIAGYERAFGRGQRRRNSDVMEEVAGLLVLAEGDSFCTVNRRAAADRNEGVDGGVLGDEVGGFVQLGNGSMLFDVGERSGVVLRA